MSRFLDLMKIFLVRDVLCHPSRVRSLSDDWKPPALMINAQPTTNELILLSTTIEH